MNMLSHLAILYFLIVPAALQGDGSMTFTAADLEFFASMRLCTHFGGMCGFVCPHRFIRHKWNIPLCPSWSQECCIGPAPSISSVTSTQELPMETTTSTPSTTAFQAAADRQQPTRVCGLVPSASRRRKRIVGGEISAPGRWPWLVALRSVLGSHTCAGAVIHPRWIVTAAHCFKHISSPSLWRVRTGEYDLLRYDEGERNVQLDNIIMHPGYRSSTSRSAQNQTLYARYVNDIALVKLRHDVDIQPICLPPGDSISDPASSVGNQLSGIGYGHCWVAGWGITMDNVVEDQLLRHVSGDVIDSQQCSQMWGTLLQNDMLCFGNGTFGPCTGDSGGPLSCERHGQFFLEGVVSWGTEDCTRNGYPSVFTRVRSYLPWIANQMNASANDV